MEPKEPKEPISDRKLAANRKNAGHSSGPKTPRGKAISSLNALTHGVFAKKTVIVGPPLLEEPLEFLAILEGLRVHYDPVGVHEDVLVQEVAVAKWKAVRLERYEAAGASERLSAAMATARTRIEEEDWTTLQRGLPLKRGSANDPNERPRVTAKALQEQIDLVDRLRAGGEVAQEHDFMLFVWMEKHGECGEAKLAELGKPEEELKTLVAAVPPVEFEDMKTLFQAQSEGVLQAMWRLRAKTVPHESAIERSLIPDEAEMNKVIRYSTYLTRLEEHKVEMIERLQAARREKEGPR